MSATRAEVVVFPATSYEPAHEIIGPLSQAGFPRAAMFVDQAGSDHYVWFPHQRGQQTAPSAVYGNGYLGKLALAGAALGLGGALWSAWRSNRSDLQQGFATRRNFVCRSGSGMGYSAGAGGGVRPVTSADGSSLSQR
jgi:hypothetical protein